MEAVAASPAAWAQAEPASPGWDAAGREPAREPAPQVLQPERAEEHGAERKAAAAPGQQALAAAACPARRNTPAAAADSPASAAADKRPAGRRKGERKARRAVHTEQRPARPDSEPELEPGPDTAAFPAERLERDRRASLEVREAAAGRTARADKPVVRRPGDTGRCSCLLPARIVALAGAHPQPFGREPFSKFSRPNRERQARTRGLRAVCVDSSRVTAPVVLARSWSRKLNYFVWRSDIY
jgi:hypothetical protein